MERVGHHTHPPLNASHHPTEEEDEDDYYEETSDSEDSEEQTDEETEVLLQEIIDESTKNTQTTQHPPSEIPSPHLHRKSPSGSKRKAMLHSASDDQLLIDWRKSKGKGKKKEGKEKKVKHLLPVLRSDDAKKKSKAEAGNKMEGKKEKEKEREKEKEKEKEREKEKEKEREREREKEKEKEKEREEALRKRKKTKGKSPSPALSPPIQVLPSRRSTVSTPHSSVIVNSINNNNNNIVITSKKEIKKVIQRSVSFSGFIPNPQYHSLISKSNSASSPQKYWNDITKGVYRRVEYQDIIVDYFRSSPEQIHSGQLLINLIDNSGFIPQYSSTGRLLKRAKVDTLYRSKSCDNFSKPSLLKSEKANENNNNNNNNQNNNANKSNQAGGNSAYFTQQYPKMNSKPHLKPVKHSKRSSVLQNAIIFKLQPIKEGPLTFKRKRRWVILDSSNLYVFKGVEDFGIPIIISLNYSAVRKQVKENLVAFEILTSGQNYLFFPDKDAANRTIDQWIEKIQEVCDAIVKSSIEGQNNRILTKTYSVLLSEESMRSSRALLSPEQRQLMQIALLDCNRVCADCKSRDPEWASINLGVFICIECSGIHRSFGTHISKVRSTKLDKWEQSWVEEMNKIGNSKSNEIWEFSIPPTFERITESSDLSEKKKWLTMKYVEGRFRKDWEERQAEKSRMMRGGSISFTNNDLKEMFLQILREDMTFREEVRKIILTNEPREEILTESEAEL